MTSFLWSDPLKLLHTVRSFLFCFVGDPRTAVTALLQLFAPFPRVWPPITTVLPSLPPPAKTTLIRGGLVLDPRLIACEITPHQQCGHPATVSRHCEIFRELKSGGRNWKKSAYPGTTCCRTSYGQRRERPSATGHRFSFYRNHSQRNSDGMGSNVSPRMFRCQLPRHGISCVPLRTSVCRFYCCCQSVAPDHKIQLISEETAREVLFMKWVLLAGRIPNAQRDSLVKSPKDYVL